MSDVAEDWPLANIEKGLSGPWEADDDELNFKYKWRSIRLNYETMLNIFIDHLLERLSIWLFSKWNVKLQFYLKSPVVKNKHIFTGGRYDASTCVPTK